MKNISIATAVFFLFVGNSIAEEQINKDKDLINLQVLSSEKYIKISLFEGKKKPKNYNTRPNGEEVAYGCSNGYYICYGQNQDICCPNGSRCSGGANPYCY